MMIRDGCAWGLAGKPHTKNPHRQWAGGNEAIYYNLWLRAWQRGRRARLAQKRAKKARTI